MRPLAPYATDRERWGMGYGVGLGLMALAFFLATLPPAWAFAPVLVLTLTVALGVAVCAPPPRSGEGLDVPVEPQGRCSTRRERSIYRATSVFIAVLIFLSFTFAAFFPSMSPDEVLYDAKAWILASTLDSSLAAGMREISTQRPLLTSLAQGVVYFAGGTAPKVVQSGFYTALILVMWGGTERLTRRSDWSALLAVLVASAPVLWWQSVLNLANLAAGFYLFGAVVALTSAVAGRMQAASEAGWRWALLGGSLLGLSAFTRFEYIAIILIPLGLFLLVCVIKGWDGLVKWACLGVLAVASWWALFVHSLATWSGGGAQFTVDLYVLATLALLAAADHWRLVTRARVLTLDPTRKCLLRASLVTAGVIVVVGFVFPAVLRLDYLVWAGVVVVLQQKHWVFSIAAVVILWWSFRARIGVGLRFVILTSWVSVLALHAAFVYVSMCRVSAFDPDRYDRVYYIEQVSQYLTDPGYRIGGSISRNMVQLYPALLFLLCVGGFGGTGGSVALQDDRRNVTLSQGR